eukprot:12673731-Alexandrium_andersonii.AAC.1
MCDACRMSTCARTAREHPHCDVSCPRCVGILTSTCLFQQSLRLNCQLCARPPGCLRSLMTDPHHAPVRVRLWQESLEREEERREWEKEAVSYTHLRAHETSAHL